MRVINLLIFMFIGSCLYGQTFTNTVTVQKDLRVQGETVLGGVSKLEDITMYADTIHIGNLDGTGSLLGISATGKVTKVSGAGATGVTGLTTGDVLYGATDGSIEQENAFTYDETINTLYVVAASGIGGVNISDDASASQVNILPIGIAVTDASDGATVTPTYFELSKSGVGTQFLRSSGGSSHTLAFPNAQGGANTFLKNDGSGNLSWATAGTVTSIATTSPITGGTITTTGTIGINDAAADGSTKGAASFTANDFDASSGNISIDYVNGQKASASVNGFVSTAAQDIAGVKTFQSNIELEGSTADANETTLTATDPTADNTVTIQDVTGTIPMAVGTPVSLTGQTAAIAATTAYTAPVDGYYAVYYNATVTTTAGVSCILGPFQVKYTEAHDNVAKTHPTSAVNFINQTNRNNTDAAISGCFTVHAKAGTDIQYIMGYTSSGSAMQYNLEVTIIKIR